MIPDLLPAKILTAPVSAFERPSFRAKVKRAHAVFACDQHGNLTVLHGKDTIKEVTARSAEFNGLSFIVVALDSRTAELEYARSAIHRIKGYEHHS
jgi:hypothetical protein